jgi:multiple sugar transport system permease protein
MALAMPAAFAVVRQRRRRAFRVMMDYNYIIRLLPGLIILVPLFEVFRTLNLLNSYLGMVLAYQVIGLPVAMATMFGFFTEVPVEIDEAAIVDGATTFQVFLRVAVPLVRSGAIATAVMVFIMTWTEFLFALILTGPQTVTAPVAILNFLKYSNVDWGALAAATVFLLVPSAVFGVATSRLFVQGLTSGAVK